MALYRLLRPLSRGDKVLARDSIDRLEGLAAETVTRLEAAGCIARISPPPLTELPDWDGRARRLLPLGIMDAGQFLECDDGRLAAHLDEGEEAVRRLKDEVIRWLQPDPRGGCCR